LAQEALARYVDRRGRPLPVLGILYVPLAVLAYARDDLAQAEIYAHEGLTLCRRLFSRAILGGDAEMTLALILFARGEQERAHALLEEARREAASAGVARVAERLALHDAMLALRAGDLTPAERYLAQRGDGQFAGSRSDRARAQLVAARILLARGRPAEARAALAELGRAVAAIGHSGRLVQIRLWEAAAAAAAGDRPAALESLRDALRLAAPEGYRRAFLDAGAWQTDLLRSARDAAPDFVDDLLARFAAQVPDSPRTLPNAPARTGPPPDALVEPLSERELEILGLIAQGASNQQIADRLVITVGTAKWHVHNILQKLDATSRSQAIARARELGLL
jgi:LuxR family maltose regulon positive regulatory protein